jgi:hypothetical protein
MCFHVPSIKEELEIGRKLDLHYFKVVSAVPLWFASGIKACKAKTSEDTGTLKVSKNEFNSDRKKACIPRQMSRDRKISLVQLFLQAGITKS